MKEKDPDLLATEVERLFNEGIRLGKTGDYTRGLAKLKESLAVCEKLPNSDRLGTMLTILIRQFEEMIAMNQGSKKTEEANTIFELALQAQKKGDFAGAVDAWTKALEIYRSVEGSERDQATCHANIGATLGTMGRYEEAIKRQEQALVIMKTIKGTERDQVDCSVNISIALKGLGRREEELLRLKQATVILSAIKGTEKEQATYQIDIGDILSDLGKYEESIQPYELAFAILKTIKGTERLQAACYRKAGASLGRIGRRREAAHHLAQALRGLITIAGSESDRAYCYFEVGQLLEDVDMYEESILHYERALTIFKTIKGTESIQAGCYGNIGNALAGLGKFEESIQRYEQTLAILKTINGTENLQAICHANIGSALGNMGRDLDSISLMKQALAVFKTIEGAELRQANCYGAIAVAMEDVGKYEEAFKHYEQALNTLKTVQGSRRSEATILGNLGDLYRTTGHITEAITSYEKSTAFGSSWRVSRGLALAYAQRNQPSDQAKALAHFLDGVRLAEERRSSVRASEHRAAIFVDPSQIFRDFIAFLSGPNVQRNSLKVPLLTAWALDEKSESVPLAAAFHYADQGKGRSLEDALREKTTLKAVRPDTKLLAEDRELSQRISKLAAMREELPDAQVERKKKLTQGIEELQQRRNMIEVELKKTVLGGYVAPEYRKPMEMARELPKGTAVLQYSIGETEGWLLILTRDEVTPYKLGADIRALPETLPRQEPTVPQLVEAWKTRREKIGVDGLVRLARARAEDLARPEKTVSAPAPDDMLSRVGGAPCQPPRHNLIDDASEKAILERLTSVVMPHSALVELHQKGIHHLLVIPDGALHYVPFAMLRLKNAKDDSTHYLVEEFGTSYIPAMTTLETIRKQAKERAVKRKLGRRGLLAFANPIYGSAPVPTVPPAMKPDEMVTRLRSFRTEDYNRKGLCLMSSLPETEQEAMRVASLFGPTKEYRGETADWPEGESLMCLQAGASEDQAKRLLSGGERTPRWQCVLFSTHGLADTFNGMLSCLALSLPDSNSAEDGFLQAQEVLNLEMDTDLVMLSACQTGLGRLRGGEGLVGLSAAFFIAGAESVCASLWQVPSGPTTQLIPEFFRNLKEGKLDRAEALRQAQLKVMRQGQSPDGKSADYSSPFCWAAFVLHGEYISSADTTASSRGAQTNSRLTQTVVTNLKRDVASSTGIRHITNSATALKQSTCTVLPGKPEIIPIVGQNGLAPKVSRLSENEFSVSYDVLERGSKAEVRIAFSQKQGRGQNLSAFETIAFNMKMDADSPPDAHCVRLGIMDIRDESAQFWINGLLTKYQRRTIPTAAIKKHFPAIDLTNISTITFIFEADSLKRRTGRLDIEVGGVSLPDMKTR